MQRTDHHTYCPFKEEASYFTLTVGSRREENSVWTYEKPYDAVYAFNESLQRTRRLSDHHDAVFLAAWTPFTTRQRVQTFNIV
jgi:Uncharacterized protein conserved in bacteria